MIGGNITSNLELSTHLYTEEKGTENKNTFPITRRKVNAI